MIKAELSHNPYLLETLVSFNGHPPRINSQIEKYEGQPLADWVYLAPNIFYHEMNGYGFDLDFTGTRCDFEELQAAFSDAGVSEDQVRIHFKNELGDCYDKRKCIAELLKWLEANRNQYFEYDAFRDSCLGVFDESVTLIAIHGVGIEAESPGVDVECVESSDELKNTVLSNTPIVFYVDDGSREAVRADIIALLRRPDVRENQLFFVVHPDMDVDRVRRVIIDLGVRIPQLVDSCDHNMVLRYLRYYPVTDRVREGVKALHLASNEIHERITAANRDNRFINKDAYEKLTTLDAGLAALKRADDEISHLDKYAIPDSFSRCVDNMLDQISMWRDRKTKITGEDVARKYAEELTIYCQKELWEFSCEVGEHYSKEAKYIRDKLEKIYGQAGVDSEFRPSEIHVRTYCRACDPELKSILLEEQNEYFVDPKSNLFSMIIHHGAEGLARVVDYDLNEWRSKAKDILANTAYEHNKYWTRSLSKYRDGLAEVYQTHIVDLISQSSQQKARALSQLSEDEKVLQENNDWFAEFSEQLESITRD